jgi:hypothetical protein
VGGPAPPPPLPPHACALGSCPAAAAPGGAHLSTPTPMPLFISCPPTHVFSPSPHEARPSPPPRPRRSEPLPSTSSARPSSRCEPRLTLLFLAPPPLPRPGPCLPRPLARPTMAACLPRLARPFPWRGVPRPSSRRPGVLAPARPLGARAHSRLGAWSWHPRCGVARGQARGHLPWRVCPLVARRGPLRALPPPRRGSGAWRLAWPGSLRRLGAAMPCAAARRARPGFQHGVRRGRGAAWPSAQRSAWPGAVRGGLAQAQLTAAQSPQRGSQCPSVARPRAWCVGCPAWPRPAHDVLARFAVLPARRVALRHACDKPVYP